MKKKFIYTSLVLFLGFNACAQNKTAIKYSKGITKEKSYKHLAILASDEYEGRETGKKGAWMAADYIKNHFKSLGLKGPVKGEYFQPIDMATNTLAQSIVTINGTQKELLKDFIIAPSSVTGEGFTFNNKAVVVAGYGINNNGYNDFAGVNIQDKVVMIFKDSSPADRTEMRKRMLDQQQKVEYLAQNNALALVIVDPALDNVTEAMVSRYNNGEGPLVMKTKEYLESLKNKKSLPIITISTQTANEILKSGGSSVEALKKQLADTKKPASKVIDVAFCATAVRKENAVRAENVLGFLEGTDPVLKKEVLVLTAHYDHIGISTTGTDKVNNGADDDGSGTTAILLLAEAFTKAKKEGHGPKRSILFMTVVGEEKGLLGSEWYSENPIFPLKNTITNLNIDMIGRVDADHEKNPDYIYIIGSDMLSSDLNNLGIKANKDYINMDLDMRYNNRTDPNRFYYRSDHYNFAKHNIPVIFYFNGVHPEYHAPGDEIDKINFPLMTRRAQLVFFTAWELANGAKRPVVDKNEDGSPR
ncbi:M28 family peptidase [Pedobacter sp.]|uniref:M28 family peptidase n=1 Tax=Pedobacter sp. TaxID=1411316 RepID=UPI003D7F29E7